MCDEENSATQNKQNTTTTTTTTNRLPEQEVSMRQQRIIDDAAAKVLKGQQMDAAEIAMQKRILKGRMDFFCKAVPKNDNEQSKKENNNMANKRNVDELNSGITTAQSEVPLKKPVLYYKFNQGFSNAVRRPVSIDDFL